MAAFLDQVPQRGVPRQCGRMRPAGSHTPRTPPQHTARRRIHARPTHTPPRPSVCVRNVRLQANRKTSVSSRVWRNYINIFIYYAKPEEDTYILPSAARAAFRTAKEHQAAAYIYLQHRPPPQHCHDAARTGTHRKKPPGCSEGVGAKWCVIIARA